MKTKLLLVAMVSGTLFSCSPYYYAPNNVNVPLFKKKGEVQLNGAMATGESHKGFNTSLAYSFTKNMGGILNASIFDAEDATNDYKGEYAIITNHNYDAGRYGKMVEAGIGYFTPISRDSSFTFETFGGFGAYSCNVAIDVKQSVAYTIYRPFIQTAIGFKYDYFEIALGLRAVKLNINNVVGSSYFNINEDEIIRFNSLDSKILLEPNFTIRVGYQSVKLQFQLVSTSYLNYEKLPVSGSVSLGLHFSF
jgi:hypothetical protein